MKMLNENLLNGRKPFEWGFFFLRPTQLITNVRRKEGGREREREEKEKEREREGEKQTEKGE